MEETPKIELLKTQAPLNAPLPFLQELGERLGFETTPEALRANDKALSLAGFVLEAHLDSETPFHRFLEGQPCRVNIDKIERKRYVLSGSVRAFRELYLEHKEQKVSKALLIFFCQHFPELFEDLWPKHGVVPPVGIEFKPLSQEALEGFELPLKLRHCYLLSSFRLKLEDLLELYELELRPVVWEKNEGLVSGFLFQPLLQYMALITRFITRDHPLKEAARRLLAELKTLHPEPFGLLED